MNGKTTNKKVSESIDEFGAMENLTPSEEWVNTLMNRLDAADAKRPGRHGISKFTAAILIIIIINAGMLLTALLTGTERSAQRDNALQIISKEMLINQDFLNN